MKSHVSEAHSMQPHDRRLRFVDLFAGLGGFHLALRRLGHECVFACEIDPKLRDLYQRNFNIEAKGEDIRRLKASAVPPHDVLCAGFPCQPFSKAGKQNGLEDPDRGGLLYELLRIVKHRRPRYLILENVPNLERHDAGRTWEKVESRLKDLDYEVDKTVLSPHYFGIPQIRERLYIVGSRVGLSGFSWPERCSAQTEISIRRILEKNPANAKEIPRRVQECIEAWQEFLDLYPAQEDLPWFPIWSMEFGATYPYADTTPAAMTKAQLRKIRGSHGQKLVGDTKEELMAGLPSHARTAQSRFPSWKIKFIELNRALYQKHKRWIDPWKRRIERFPSSFQKFEWNCKGEQRQLHRFVLQVRASGLRVKRPTTAPSLVAMTSTQVPIIAWENRYMTPRECQEVQSMSELKFIPESTGRAYAAFGNAVNVDVAEAVAKALVG